jgi:hypothetical protein
MTDRELRLRRRIDLLQDALERARRPHPPRPRRQHCGYCGAPTTGRVCRAHSDLEDAA